MLFARTKTKRTQTLRIKPEVFSQSFWMMKLINKVMYSGKKAQIEKFFSFCFYAFKKDYANTHPPSILFKYLLTQRPTFDFSRVRLSRIFKKIPIPIAPKRQIINILTWFVSAIREIKMGSLKQKLYKELKAIRNGNQKTALTQYKVVQEFYFQITSHRIYVRFRWK